MNYFSITYHSFLILLLSILVNLFVVVEKIRAQTSVKQITSNDVFLKLIGAALYHAKDSGINCIVDLDDLPAEGSK